jgi:poly(A) polymerase
VIPAGRLARQDWLEEPETRAVAAALASAGAEVRFVGGCVRDAILDRPIRDIDIATGDPPDRVIRLLQDAGIRAVPTGLNHGTVTAVVGAAHFEVTTLRLDVETDGRRARVEYTDDWRADAARRDFTINALYCDPDGRLFDPFGGLADLRGRRVLFVGDARARIREDVLRLLRFFRFLAYYGNLPADADSLAACRELAHLLPTLSGERVAGEVLRLLGAPDPGPVVALMRAEGILAYILPEATGLARLDALVTIEGLTLGTDPLRRLGALLAPDAAAVTGVARRLRLSGAERARLLRLADPTSRIERTPDARRPRRLLHKLGADGFRDLTLLAWAEALAGSATPSHRGAAGWRTLLVAADEWVPLSLPVKGGDVLDLGVTPGPEVGRLLDAVEAWWVEGDFQAGRADALGKLRALVAAGPVGANGKQEGKARDE